MTPAVNTLPLSWPDDEPPYEPSPEDLAEYAAWSAEISDHRREDFCPADFGHYCEDCDREMAEALRLEAANMSDAWYRDLCARAEFRHDHWRDA
jgi:hypothetical protein